MRIGELLAPAGSKAAAIAAINAGANAVYLGGKRFGARAFAENFGNDDIGDLIRYAHLRGASVYVTINTLVYDDEFDDLVAYADALVARDVDALIVQDLGVLDVFIHRYPNTPIHASTQMNVHLPEQAKKLADLGVSRIILARETSVDTIRAIRSLTDVELEVFVHGAICVSYSGNCLFSSLVGGRSGNRGECAQLCRLPYTLLKDGTPVSDEAYLMSPKDLMTLERLADLAALGIASYKIEGRMRKPEYVAQTVSSYRHALDTLAGGEPVDFQSEIAKLKRVFNREYTPGYLFNTLPNDINNPYRPNHMGVEVGTVTAFARGKATVRLSDMLEVNDGIRFLGPTDSGNVVSRILAGDKMVTRAFAGETIQLDSAEEIVVGATVMKTLDHALENELAAYADEAFKKVGLDGVVKAFVGSPLTLEVRDVEGRSVVVETPFAIAAAATRPMGRPEIEEQIAKLGNTPFFWRSLSIETDGIGFIPVKALNETRRLAIERLSERRVAPRREPKIVAAERRPAGFEPSPFSIIAKVRTEEQLQAAWAMGVTTIVHEEILSVDPTAYPGVRYIPQRLRIRPAGASFDLTREAYASELSALDNPFVADMFMNVTNRRAVNFLGRHGARAVTLSAEMSQERVKALIDGYIAEYGEKPALEIVAYGFQDLMISKFCPIAKTFKTKAGCTLCERNRYSLRDRMGYEFPLVNDGNCNIRVLNSRSLNLIDFVGFIQSVGIAAARLDFTIEDGDETRGVIAAFQKAFKKQAYVVDRRKSTYGRFVK
ncbi:MAG: U32 family peptidase [Candidatus Izemoplasmatales bacterium]